MIYITNTRLQWIDKQVNKIKKGVNALIYSHTCITRTSLGQRKASDETGHLLKEVQFI